MVKLTTQRANKWLVKLKKWVATNKKTLEGKCIFRHENDIYLLFHSKNDDPDLFTVAKGFNGLSFEVLNQKLTISEGSSNEIIHFIKSLSVIKHEELYHALYFLDHPEKAALHIAQSSDLSTFVRKQTIPHINKKTVFMYNKKKDNFVLYFGQDSIYCAQSSDLFKWEVQYNPVLVPENNEFKQGKLEPIGLVNFEGNILLFYAVAINSKGFIHYCLGMALCDSNDPHKVLWKTQKPLWIQDGNWENKTISPFGISEIEGAVCSYWNVEDVGIYSVIHPFAHIKAHLRKDHFFVRLDKPEINPIIAPNQNNQWEGFNTFNPAAVYEAGKVHIVYRAQGYDYISVLGYASSKDGLRVDERLDEPCYIPSEAFEYRGEKKPKKIKHMYVSGGGYGGCEDPRLTKIDDKFYMTYVAFDGYSPPRVALTSIAVDDFLAKRWLWEKPVLISPPNVVNKNAVIFPEKINGKYVIIHRVYPDILIDYFDSLDFDGTKWLEGQYKITPRRDYWDSRKVGAGPPPLKTPHGWLLIYQAVGEQDPGKYKIGAMLLDLKKPQQVLHRTNTPILEPDKWYENEGFKAGVAYPCGAVVIDETLYVYYGGADSYVCVATASFNEFIHNLLRDKPIHLEPARTVKIL